MPRTSEYSHGIYAGEADRGAPRGVWPELGIEDPRPLGLTYELPQHMELAAVEGKQVLRFGSPHEGGLAERRSPLASPALSAFGALAQETEVDFPGAVLRFARQWGPLELCSHNLPRFHPPGPDAQPCGPTRDLCPHGSQRFHSSPCYLRQATTVGAMRWDEPLEVWRRFCRSAAALLSILSELTQRAGVGTSEAWWNTAWGRASWTPVQEEAWCLSELEVGPGQPAPIRVPLALRARVFGYPRPGTGGKHGHRTCPRTLTRRLTGLPPL